VLCRRGSIGRSLRTERYRYTVWEDGDAIELYDHRCDPHELVNLADEPGHEAEINALNRQLDACCPLTDWRVRVGRAGRSP
jgi:iduronate 2-sulfatase